MSFRKSLCLLGLAVSLSLNAGVYQCKEGDVSTPCESNGWMLGGDALYMSAGTARLPTNLVRTPAVFNYSANWGFRIEAARLFGQGKDFNVNWTYLNTGSQRFIDISGSIHAQGAANQAMTSSEYLSMVNLEVGQRVDFGDDWDVRMHGGMEITNSTEDLEALIGGVNQRDFKKDQFVGARVGTNIMYHFWDAFSYHVDAALGLLYNATRFAGPVNGAHSNSRQNNAPSVVNYVETGTAVSLDYNIGLDYSYHVSQGDLLTRAGWAAYNFHAGDLISWQGLYFGAKWLGNA